MISIAAIDASSRSPSLPLDTNLKHSPPDRFNITSFTQSKTANRHPNSRKVDTVSIQNSAVFLLSRLMLNDEGCALLAENAPSRPQQFHQYPSISNCQAHKLRICSPAMRDGMRLHNKIFDFLRTYDFIPKSLIYVITYPSPRYARNHARPTAPHPCSHDQRARSHPAWT